MPGVHIHKISEFDWLEQQEGSTLTVPGSYWLCYKNNIYKFTFKYHRTIRNSKEFIYGKELMKIIRRIIKSQPCQGQQFRTKHILVTYNHTSWTRQDKMFAILKFQKHTEAATVSRAIVLTVKIFKDESYMPDGMIIYSETEPKPIKSLNRTSKDNGRKNIESECKVDTKTSNLDELRINTTDTNKHVNNLSLYHDQNNLTLSSVNNENITDEDNIIKCNRKSSSNVSLINESVNLENKDAYKNKNCSISFKKRETEKNEYQNSIEKSSLSNKIEFQEIMQHEEIELQQMNDNSSNNIINSNDEGVIDSVNLPYQYLIEKEIENAKKKVVRISLLNVNKSISIIANQELNADSTTKSENKHIKKGMKENNGNNKNYIKHKVSETGQSNEEQCTKSTKYLSASSKELINDHDKANKDHSKSKRNGELEKKIDDNTVKSSNITDLIMKGRMFMIQQDQDIVSVVEQKTKSDIDEVLENSEKFETKEGEKCLLNSSLLKLENLITMIEVPKESIKSNNESKITINNNLSLNSIFITKDSINDQHIEVPINVMDSSTFINSQNIATSSKSFIHNEEHESNMKNIVICDATTKCKENVLENIEGEKDITSEMQYWNNESTNLFEETSNSCKRLDIKDHLITNVEHDLTVSEDHINSNKSKGIEATNNCNIISNNVSNVPRIISSQIITIDEMPLALQNIVKEKLSKRNTSINHKSNLHDSSSHITRLTSSNKSAVLDVTSKVEFLETESLSNVKKCLTPSSDNIVTKYNNASLICSNIENTKETEISRKKRKKSNDYDAKNQSIETENNKTILSTQCKIYYPKNKRRHRKRKKQQDYKYNTKMKVKMMKMSTHTSDAVKTKNSTLPNKLQDITEEFYQDLMQHGKHSNSTFDQKALRHTRSLYLQTDIKNEDKRIEMLKFIEDITRGVKVVVKRMSIKKYYQYFRK
ncbi:homeobox protein 3-like [Vespa crabro]|uniref:homeobox protein 3-like n=1 Tax=Vespa crabro TaxID=7445 RepID=UPI001EFF97C7|nr:homeobox protein 3-like [Vespa crabro]XP_046834905.1 homeobox protein 3-like [Vespa crabro]